MRSLVFGGTGMLGRALVRELRRRGWAALGLAPAQADLTDRRRLLYWADIFQPEAVFNCAAFTRVDDCEKEPERALEVNGSAVANAVAAADSVGAQLLQVSTDYVFAGTASVPYATSAPTAPASAYGRSKLEGERQAAAYAKSAIVRTSWLFGPGGPNFVRTIAGLLSRAEAPLRVVDDQRGCPTYTPFLARALADLAGSRARGFFHYRNREDVTWYAFAVEIARELGSPAEIRPVTTAEFPRPAARPAYSVLDVSSFEAIAGRRVEPWVSGLSEYLSAPELLRIAGPSAQHKGRL
jgi:dTDP-4-dehydrorhamnose reductase